MNLIIRPVTTGDVEAILGMIREFAEFEGLSHALEVTADDLHEALFGAKAIAEGLFAEYDGAAAGYALFFPHFASFRGQRGYYLEDIYIRPQYRRQGAGEAMLRTLARHVAASGGSRIDFMVLAWNEPAVKFYEKLGGIRDDEERHFKFTDAAFTKLSA